MRKNINFALLSIPGFTPKLWKANWVDEDFDFVNEINPSDSVVNPVINWISETRRTGSLVAVVPGFMTTRKNPQLALKTITEVNKKFNKRIHLLFAGKVHPEIHDLLLTFPTAHFKLFDVYLSSQDYYDVIANSDVTLLLYENVGNSFVGIESIALGTPVLFSGSRHWRNFVNANSKMIKLTNLDEKECARLLIDIIGDDPQEKFTVINPFPKTNLIDFLSTPFQRKL